jgi:hypothetical protein
MGVLVPLMTLVHEVSIAYPLLVLIGAMAGFFVVPMNALLQHRGHVLMSAGHSIAVQNFNENLAVLVMLSLYALMINFNWHINTVITLFGSTVAVAMLLVIRKHKLNPSRHDSIAEIGRSHH